MFLTVFIAALACGGLVFVSHSEKDRPKEETPISSAPADTGTYDHNDRRSKDIDTTGLHGDCTGNTPQEPWQGTSK